MHKQKAGEQITQSQTQLRDDIYFLFLQKHFDFKAEAAKNHHSVTYSAYSYIQCCGAGARAGGAEIILRSPSRNLLFRLRSLNYLFTQDLSHFTILSSVWRMPG